MELKLETHKSYSKLAQIYNSFQDVHPTVVIIKNLMKKEGNINHKFPSKSRIDLIEPTLIEGTALHIAAIKNDPAIFKILLNNGADYNAQNHEGCTPLHCAIYKADELEEPKELVNILFSKQLSLADPSNPEDVHELSHFHIACMYNRSDVVEFLCNNGISVDKAVTFDSKRFPGYSSLHFAAENIALSAIKVLLKHEANINVKNARGLTPLQILLEKKIQFLDPDLPNEKLPKNTSFQAIDDVINLLLDSNDVDHIGLTHFHIACTQRDKCVAEYLIEQESNINQQVNMDSPIFPGYTALHFAAYCNVGVLKMLLENKAAFLVKDAYGVTPMDLFWMKCKHEDLIKILSHDWNYLTFSDQRMRLIDLVKATGEPIKMEDYLQSVKNLTTKIEVLPRFWLGRTLLHFAVMACKSIDIIEVCTRLGLESQVDVQDLYGSTPIHLAFRSNKLDIVELLMKFSQGPTFLADNEGLAYLHIASALNDVDYIRQFLPGTHHKNMVYDGLITYGPLTPGSTALHVAISKGNIEIIKLLLDIGSELNVEDKNNQTPLHRFLHLSENVEAVCHCLLSSTALTDEILEEIGLTRLHMSIYCQHVNISSFVTESNINAVIKCKDMSSLWHEYDGYTPLYLATKRCLNTNTIKMLLEAGADLMTMDYSGNTPLYATLANKSRWAALQMIVRILPYDINLQKRMEEQSGITMLHIACYALHEEIDYVSWLLDEKLDVNSKVKSDCFIWKGYTPLHALMKSINSYRIRDDFLKILTMMLTAGADLVVEDDNGETPIHLAMRHVSLERINTLLTLLFKNLRTYDVNPVDRNGMSHFHIACLLNDYAAIKLFLENGIDDINQPVDFFAKNFAGETPLHLALDCYIEKHFQPKYKQQTIDLLLNYGADVNAEDNYGYTSLHKAVRLKDNLPIMSVLIEYGASIDTRNIFEETPLELLLRSDKISIESVEYFERFGCHLKMSNPFSEESYISMILPSDRNPQYKPYACNYNISSILLITETLKKTFVTMIKTSDSILLDNMGRHYIHNIVTTNSPLCEIFEYNTVFQKFRLENIDIDMQDNSGKTALHLAAKFGNFLAIEHLLENGADINVLDAANKTPLNYAMEYFDNRIYCSRQRCHKKVIALLVQRVSILRQTFLEIIENNILEKDLAMMNPLIGPIDVDYDNINKMISDASFSCIKDEPNLLLGDFLSDKGIGLISYPYLEDMRRKKIDEYFRNYNGPLKGICLLQYKKSVKRVDLLNSALDCARKTSTWTIPTCCSEIIFNYLTNSDLKIFIKGLAD